MKKSPIDVANKLGPFRNSGPFLPNRQRARPYRRQKAYKDPRKLVTFDAPHRANKVNSRYAKPECLDCKAWKRTIWLGI